MGLAEDLLELSVILSDEQLAEYVIKLRMAQRQFTKDIEDNKLDKITRVQL